jgi:hypothetical protein
VASHEASLVTSGAACVPLQAKVRSMTQRRGNPGRLTRPAPGPYQRNNTTPILTMPSPAAIRDIYQALTRCHIHLGLTRCHTGRPGQSRAELVPPTHPGAEANFIRRTLSVIRKGAGLYEASSLRR